jgi:hypothetical protein
VEWIALVPLFVGLTLGRYFRGRAVERLSPLGRRHRARAWWLRWAAGRDHYTPEGWRDQMRALWIPLAGAAASAALVALLALRGGEA